MVTFIISVSLFFSLMGCWCLSLFEVSLDPSRKEYHELERLDTVQFPLGIQDNRKALPSPILRRVKKPMLSIASTG